jgi:hypothetical protein
MKSVCVLSKDNQPTSVVEFNKQFKVEIAYEVFKPLRNVAILCRITDSHGNIILTSRDTDTTDWDDRVREPGQYLSICQVPGALLKPGRYLLSIGARTMDRNIEFLDGVLTFDVSEVGSRLNSGRIGIIAPLLRWEVNRNGGD